MRARPFPTEAEISRARAVAAGCEMDGLDGTLWRLLRLCDVELVSRWCTGERIRGTPPERLFDTMAIFVSAAVIQAAGQVPRKLVQSAAQDIMRNAAALLHKDVAAVVANKKSEALLRSQLKLVPGME